MMVSDSYAAMVIEYISWYGDVTLVIIAICSNSLYLESVCFRRGLDRGKGRMKRALTWRAGGGGGLVGQGGSVGVEFLTSDRIKETEQLQRSAWENTASVSHTDSWAGIRPQPGGGSGFSVRDTSLLQTTTRCGAASMRAGGAGMYFICVIVFFIVLYYFYSYFACWGPYKWVWGWD